MKTPWQKLGSKVVYKNPYWQVREDDVIQPDEKRGKYYVVDRLPFALTIPLINNNQIILIRHWRYIADKNSWEFPAGGCERNETLIHSAKRELREETGIIAKKWKLIGSGMTSNGFSNEAYKIFLAAGLSFGPQELDGSESDMIFKKFTISQVDKMIKDGKIHDTPTIAALYILKLYLKI